MTQTVQEILNAVAEGRLTPEEAANELDAVDAGRQVAEVPADPRHPVERLAVRGAFRKVRVLGDPTVATAVAEGPHTVSHDGGTLVVAGEGEAGSGSYRVGRWGWVSTGWWTEGGVPDLTVRVRPDLPVAVDLAAGSLHVEGMKAHVKAEIAAGAARLERLSGPFDVEARAGSVTVSGTLASGASRIACQAGSVTVVLGQGSGVRIKARSNLGRIVLPGDSPGRGPEDWLGGGTRDLVVGDGRASLDIDVTMGTATVSLADGARGTAGDQDAEVAS